MIPSGGDLSLPSIATLQKVLADMRSAINSGKCQFIPRDKNMRTLTGLGLSVQDMKDEIYSLTPSQYHAGPKVDRNDPSSDFWWEFKTRIDGQVIYIKFKILYQTDDSMLLMSFHFDE